MKIKAYHISHRKYRQSILANGLIPASKTDGRIQYGPRIFISTNTADLGFDFVNFENVDCWEFEVDSASIKPDLFSGSTNHFYIENAVRPGLIQLRSSH
jgi:hypothetical protein